MIRLPTVVREVVVLFRRGTRKLFLVDSVQRSSGAHTVGSAGFFFSGVKRSKLETTIHPTDYRFEKERAYAYTSHMPYGVQKYNSTCTYCEGGENLHDINT